MFTHIDSHLVVLILNVAWIATYGVTASEQYPRSAGLNATFVQAPEVSASRPAESIWRRQAEGAEGENATLSNDGTLCNGDSKCSSKLCRTHCCSKKEPRGCEACGNNGMCFSSLAYRKLSAGKPNLANPLANALQSSNSGWSHHYSQYVKEQLAGPPANFISKVVDLKTAVGECVEERRYKKTDKKEYQNTESTCGLSYRLLWARSPTAPLIRRAPGNRYFEKGATVGAWGAMCKCANGEVFEVGDLNNKCKSVACFGDGKQISNCRNGGIAKVNAGNAVFCGANESSPTASESGTGLSAGLEVVESSLNGYINTDECYFAKDGECDLHLCGKSELRKPLATENLLEHTDGLLRFPRSPAPSSGLLMQWPAALYIC